MIRFHTGLVIGRHWLRINEKEEEEEEEEKRNSSVSFLRLLIQ